MRKSIFLTALFVLMSSVVAFAGPRAIGARLGYGAEFSYQHGLNSGNMVSLDAGLIGTNGLEVAATHDWIFNISAWDKKGSWNWYAGVGAGVGVSDIWVDNANHYFVGAAGRIGAEYNFWFPLQLSLDWRPVVGPHFYKDGNNATAVGFNYNGLYQGGFCLGVRYLFH